MDNYRGHTSHVTTHTALAGVAAGDAGELAVEGGGEREAAQPFHLGGCGGVADAEKHPLE